MSVSLRPMVEDDLRLVEAWLGHSHVARWWGDDPQDELADYRRCISGADPTHALTVLLDGRAVGWCQWYRWWDYPEAVHYGAREDDIGIDYAIGEPDLVGAGVGSAMIAALVTEIRAELPGADLLVAVATENTPSRRVLEKNGFDLVELRAIESETEELSALYRLDGAASARSRSSGTRGPR